MKSVSKNLKQLSWFGKVVGFSKIASEHERKSLFEQSLVWFNDRCHILDGVARLHSVLPEVHTSESILFSYKKIRLDSETALRLHNASSSHSKDGETLSK